MLQELNVAARKAGLHITMTSDKSCWSSSRKWRGQQDPKQFMRLEAGQPPLTYMDTKEGLPLLGSVWTLDGRTEAAANMAVFDEKYFLPPFMITTESGAAFRHWGHYMTNFGATLGAVMYGFAGVQPSDDLTGKVSPTSYGVRAAALPLGWDEISYVAYFGGARYQVKARHGQRAQITLLAEDELSGLNVV